MRETPGEAGSLGDVKYSQGLLGAALLVLGLWRVLDKVYTLLDVTLETLDGGFDELLLIRIGAAERIGGFLCTRWLVSD